MKSISRFSRMALVAILSIGLFSCLAGCEPDHRQPSADQVMQRQQEQLSAAGNAKVGMAAVQNFQEKQLMKLIIEVRDTALTTYTYTQDMNGRYHKLCDSVGYGLPYATQFTSPSKVETWERYNGHAEPVIIPQADPNGLFSPASADGTWVACLDPKTKKLVVLYIEPHVIVSPFELTNS